MPVLLKIAGWDTHFENNRSRELKNIAWVPMPNRHDGDGYTELLDHKDGPAHFGVWCAIVQVASKCDPRGTLLRDGARPHDSGSLARMIRFPEKVVSGAVERLVSIGWITLEELVVNGLTEIPHDGAALGRHNPAPKCDLVPKEQNRKEKKRRDASASLASAAPTPECGSLNGEYPSGGAIGSPVDALSPPTGVSKSKTDRTPDLVWEALVAAFGEPETKAQRKSRNAACKELRDAHATPQEIRSAKSRWREMYPNATCTPHALAKHWGELKQKAESQNHAARNAVAEAVEQQRTIEAERSEMLRIILASPADAVLAAAAASFIKHPRLARYAETKPEKWPRALRIAVCDELKRAELCT